MFRLLPKPPDPDELQRHIPVIEPVPVGVERPFWSVMIPAYNCAHYLRKTLASVLVQDPGPERMQIEVVDDCSTKDDPESVVRELGKGRVSFFRQASNRGATRTFNTCVARARGQWVHLLHGDDMVSPGFYETYRRAACAARDVALVFGPSIHIDSHGNQLNRQPDVDSPNEEFLVDATFVQRQALANQVLFPAVAVSRAAYEKVGGFTAFLSHVADMHMWFRLASVGSVVRVCRPLSLYRIHEGSDTSRLMVSGDNIREAVELMQANCARFPELAASNMKSALCRLGDFAELTAWKLDAKGSLEGRFNQAFWAWKLEPSTRRLSFLVRSWLKLRMRPRRSS